MKKFLLEADVAVIDGVETKRINEAEFSILRSKISTAKSAKTKAVPKAFTEKGLYMIATRHADAHFILEK